MGMPAGPTYLCVARGLAYLCVALGPTYLCVALGPTLAVQAWQAGAVTGRALSLGRGAVTGSTGREGQQAAGARLLWGRCEGAVRL